MISKVKEFYDGYLDKLKDVKPRHKWVFNSIDRFIPKNTRVLDIGCGTGITSKHLAKGGRRVVAVDLSPRLIEYAKEHNGHEGITYTIDDIVSLEFYPDEFDAILMVDVIEHILTDSMKYLFSTLDSLTHENTKIYLNMPSSVLAHFLKENRPDLLQVVDNPISAGKIIEMFESIGFVPHYFQLYWNQYVEYLFITKEASDKLYSQMFKKE